MRKRILEVQAVDYHWISMNLFQVEFSQISVALPSEVANDLNRISLEHDRIQNRRENSPD